MLGSLLLYIALSHSYILEVINEDASETLRSTRAFQTRNNVDFIQKSYLKVVTAVSIYFIGPCHKFLLTVLRH